MKDLKEKWEKELDIRLPELRQDILNEPIPQKTVVEKPRKRLAFKYLPMACSIAAVVVLCICIIPLLRSKDPTGQTPKPNGPIVEVVEDSTLITVEINPRAVFVSDKNGIVTNVVATNSDADVILSTEGFDALVIGKATKDALVSYVELATKLGYINADTKDNAVKITSTDTEKDLVALSEAKESLEAHFKSKGIYAVVIDNVATIDKICEINEIEKTDKIENVIKDFKNRAPLYSKNELDKLPDEGIKEYYKGYVASQFKDEVEEALDVASSILNGWELYWSLYARFGDYWMIMSQEQGIENLPPEYKEIAEQLEQILMFLEGYGINIESFEKLKYYCDSFWYNGIALGNMEYLRQEISELEKVEKYDKYKNLFEVLEFNSSQFDKLETEFATKEDIKKAQDELIKQEGANRIESNKDGYEKEREEIDSDSYDRYLEEIKNQYGSADDFWNEKKQNKNN